MLWRIQVDKFPDSQIRELEKMNILNLSPVEIDLIISMLGSRKVSWKNLPNQIQRIDAILGHLSLPSIYLTRRQKDLIIGCLREYFIYPNQDLLNLTEFEILISRDALHDKLAKLDIGIVIMNKLKKQTEKPFKTFGEVIHKIDQIIHSKKIYYSQNQDGKIYKLAIEVKNNEGVRIDLEGTNLEYFRIEKFDMRSYSKYSAPMTVLEAFETYFQNKDPNETQERVIKILKEIIRYN